MRALLLVVLVACTTEVDATDAIYANNDMPRVLCSLGVDGEDIALIKLELGMQRARSRGETLLLHAHRPGTGPDATIDPARVDAILSAADRVGLASVTFPELPHGSGLMLSFDDASVDDWFALRDVFDAHATRATFFVSNFGELTLDQRAKLHVLADEGHAIEAHGMGHRDAPTYADAHGVTRYLADEIDPLLDAMLADGFTPTTFAYPYGARTKQLDDALLERFRLIRSLTYLDKSVVATAPCPY
jgi:peptidoglycan/xylan/chitin deacetylase (PgdA/CDA1 family)